MLPVKRCSKCHKDRPPVSFSSDAADPYASWCQACRSTILRPCRHCGAPYETGHAGHCSIICQVKARCANVNDPEACWPWLGATKENGYGVIRVRNETGGWSMRTPARAMYAAVHGAVPRGYSVLNTCHTKNCCNPAHLKLEIQELLLEAPHALIAS